MKTIIIAILIAGLAMTVPAEENGNSSAVYTVEEIIIEGTEFEEKSILRYMPVKIGSQLTIDELEKKLYRGRIWVQYDPNYYFLNYEYQTEGDKVHIKLNIIDASMPLTFDAFESGPVVGYRNIFGEGINLNAWMGYSRQMLELYWKRIANGPIGISLIAGHRFFNPFIPQYRSSSPGGTAEVFLWLSPQIALGATSNLYAHSSPPTGFNTNAASLNSASVGGFLDMRYMALMDLIGVGFNFKTEYLYYLKDLNNGTHRINIREQILMRPFPTDRFAISIRGDLSWASKDLVDKGHVPLSGKVGRSAWQAGLFFPINIVKISTQANYYIGLEPGFWVGKAGTDNLEFNNPDLGISLAPTFQVGFPASVFFSTRFLYNLNEKKLHFSFAFSSLPYTQELDMEW